MRYIVRFQDRRGYWVLDNKTNKLFGPFDDRRIAAERADKLNKDHERATKR